jgi:hypothetical protein
MLIEYVLYGFSVGGSTHLRANHHQERQKYGNVFHHFWLAP